MKDNCSMSVPCKENSSLLSLDCASPPLLVQHCVLLPLNFLNIVFNSLSILVISLTPTLHNIHNGLIASLALSDSVEGTVSLVVNVFFFTGGLHCSRNCENVFGHSDTAGISCVRFIVGIVYACNYVSLMLIAMEHWLYICKPFVYQRIVTPRYTARALGLVFLLACMFNIDHVIFSYNTSQSDYFLRLRRSYIFPIVHSLHSLLTFILYLHITLTALQQLRSTAIHVSPQATILSQKSGNRCHTQRIRKNLRAVKLFLMAFGVFFLSLSPYVYFRAVKPGTPTSLESLIKILTFESLPAIHYLGNFFVFAMRDRGMSQAFRKYLCPVQSRE